jgi:hypothetical protein
MQQADAPRQAFLAAQKREKKTAADADKLAGVIKDRSTTYKYGQTVSHR